MLVALLADNVMIVFALPKYSWMIALALPADSLCSCIAVAGEEWI